jgi:F-type H+-transporting ATPase subunit epsilon
VITWRDAGGREHHVAVCGGMLEVRAGQTIAVATQEAVPGDDLRALETEVLAAFRRAVDDEQSARSDAQRLYLAAIREIHRFLRPERSSALSGASRLGERDQ